MAHVHMHVAAGLLVAAVIAPAAAETSTRPGLPTFQSPDLAGLTASPVARVLEDGGIVVLLDGRQTIVRLIGVDASEAPRFVGSLLRAESVFLVGNGRAPEPDASGQTFVYAYRAPDGLFINAELIRQGRARVDTSRPFKYRRQFEQLQRSARQGGRGLWFAAAERPAVVAAPGRPAEPADLPRQPGPASVLGLRMIWMISLVTLALIVLVVVLLVRAQRPPRRR